MYGQDDPVLPPQPIFHRISAILMNRPTVRGNVLPLGHATAKSIMHLVATVSRNTALRVTKQERGIRTRLVVTLIINRTGTQFQNNRKFHHQLIVTVNKYST